MGACLAVRYQGHTAVLLDFQLSQLSATFDNNPIVSSMAATSSSSRALNAILPLIASGQAYEAHQKARTFASRYAKANQFDTAIDVLFQSARELLKSGQQGSGTDLTGFLLDVYESKGEPVNDESRGAHALLRTAQEVDDIRSTDCCAPQED